MTLAVLPNPSARAEWLLASIIDRALNHIGHVPPLDGGTGDNDHADSETVTAIPDDDDDHDIASLASHPSVSVQPSSLLLCPPAPVGQFASAFLMFPRDLELDALFEDHGVSCTVIEDMLTLEQAITLGQLPLSGIQKFDRRKCVRFLQDLVAAAVLTPHRADFPRQLLDLAHEWSERQDNDIHIFGVLSLAAAVYIFSKTDPGWAQEPRYTRQLPDLLAAIAGLLARPQLHNAPTMHPAWTIEHSTRAEFRILEVLKYELATPTPAAWIEIFERRPSLWEEQHSDCRITRTFRLRHHSYSRSVRI